MQKQALPPPNIRELPKSELAAIEKKIEKLTEAFDFEGLANMTQYYPLSADTLDDLKRNEGMEFLLRNKVNLIEAVKKYGMEWITL